MYMELNSLHNNFMYMIPLASESKGTGIICSFYTHSNKTEAYNICVC